MNKKNNLQLIALATLLLAPSLHSAATTRRTGVPAKMSQIRSNSRQELMDILKRDNLVEFKKYLASSLPSSILREAENKQAKKIVNFLLNNNLVDFEKDPASLTWFALWRPTEFNRLISMQFPSNKALDGALDALEHGHFAEVKPEEMKTARELLIGAGAMTQEQRSLPTHV